MTQEGDGGDATAAEFADALADLKRRGSMLLVAGVGHDALASACGRLLGGEGAETRRRLLVSTNHAGPGASAPGPHDRSRRIHYRVDARSAAAGSAGGAAPGVGSDAPATAGPGESVHAVDGGLSALLGAIDDEIDGIERRAGGLDPAELRVCVDSADAIIAEHDREATFEFFHALSGVLRDARAMGHVHLPATFGDESVQVLAPLFDAVIEVDGGSRQRWHLRDPEVTTDWLTL